MRNKLLITVLLLAIAQLQAEKIYLKTGKVFDCNIDEQNDTYVYLNCDGTRITIRKDIIEKIEGAINSKIQPETESVVAPNDEMQNQSQYMNTAPQVVDTVTQQHTSRTEQEKKTATNRCTQGDILLDGQCESESWVISAGNVWFSCCLPFQTMALVNQYVFTGLVFGMVDKGGIRGTAWGSCALYLVPSGLEKMSLSRQGRFLHKCEKRRGASAVKMTLWTSMMLLAVGADVASVIVGVKMEQDEWQRIKNDKTLTNEEKNYKSAEAAMPALRIAMPIIAGMLTISYITDIAVYVGNKGKLRDCVKNEQKRQSAISIMPYIGLSAEKPELGVRMSF